MTSLPIRLVFGERWTDYTEIAAALRVKIKAVQNRAKRANWPYTERTVAGGKKRFFQVMALPADVREALDAARRAALQAQVDQLAAARVAAEAAVAPTAPAPLPLVESGVKRTLVPIETATHRQTIVRDARLGICNAVVEASETHGMTESRAINAWLDGITSGEMPMPQQLWCALANDKGGFGWEVTLTAGGAIGVPIAGQSIPAFAGKLGKRSVQRWLEQRRDGGDDALIPGRPQKDMRPPPWAGVFLEEMQRPQKPTLATAWQKMAERLQAAGWRQHQGAGVCGAAEYPAYATVCAWYRTKYSNLDRHKGCNTGSAMNPYKFAHKRSSAGMWPLLEVHSDGWNTHFTAPHPISGKFVTFEIWHSHDVFTRKAYVHERSIGLSENTAVILGSLYAVAVQDGEPVVWQTDNTGSVKNDRVEFDPCGSIAARRGISIVHNLPGNSQANGIAENFNKYLDERSKDLATYQGKAQDSLTAKRVLKITQKLVKAQAAGDSEEALRLRAEAARTGCGIVFGSYGEAVAWVKQIVAEFNDRPHRSLPRLTDTDARRRHMTPNEMMARAVADGWKPAPIAGDDLADAFRVHERKTIRRGLISILGQDYHCAGMDDLNGEEVLVAYDIENGKRVFVKSLEGVPLFQADFYATRHFRPMDFYEIALEKRSDAQIKRLGDRIDDIEAQRPANLIEQRATITVPMAMPGFEPSVQTLIEAARPKPNLLHLDDPALIRWLAAHPEDWNDNLRRYLDETAEKLPSVADLIDEFDLWGELAGFERAVAS